MNSIVNTPIQPEELKILFRFHIMDKLKIYSKLSPLRKHSRGNGYDNAEVVKEKLSAMFDFKNYNATPPHEFRIALKIEEEMLNSLAELEEYIKNLSHRASNYRIALVAGEPIDATIDRFLLRVQKFMKTRGLEQYAGEVVSVVAEIVKLANFNDIEKANFYRSLANNKKTKQLFYDILSNACEEFKRSSPDKLDIPFMEKSKCECPSEYSDYSDRYTRRSLALKHSLDTIKGYDHGPLDLSIARCVTSGATWHYWIQVY
jgi:hypothetical protein